MLFLCAHLEFQHLGDGEKRVEIQVSLELHRRYMRPLSQQNETTKQNKANKLKPNQTNK